jgi:hypothetical protein
MSERKRIEVDEAALQRMMARDDQSYLIGEVVKPVEKEPELQVDAEIVQDFKSEQTVQTKEETPVPENELSKAQRKRKAPKSDFSEMFLKERTVKNRKQIYVSVETYEMIRRYLKYIGDTSLIAYIDNILLQHIDEYKDTITEMINKKFSNPF